MIESVEEIGGEEGDDDEGGGIVGIILVCVFLFVCYTLLDKPTGTNTAATTTMTGSQAASSAPVPAATGTSIASAPTPKWSRPMAFEWPGAQVWSSLASTGDAHRRVFVIAETEDALRRKTAGSYGYWREVAGVSTNVPTYVKRADTHDAASIEHVIQYKASEDTVEIFRYETDERSTYNAKYALRTTDGAIVFGSEVVGYAYVRPARSTASADAPLAARLRGASTLFLKITPEVREITLFDVEVGTKRMSDVWVSQGATRASSYYITASGTPHHGGPTAPTGAMVCVYSMNNDKLTYLAYYDEASKKFKTYAGADSQYEVRLTRELAPAAATRAPTPVAAISSIGSTPTPRPSTPRPLTVAPSTPRPITVAPATPGPVTSAPSGLTVSEWQIAPAHRKCFHVWAKFPSAKLLEGWYSYRKTSEQEMWYWYKAAYGTVPEARLTVSKSKNINAQVETVTVYSSASPSASFACQLAGLMGQTDAIGVSCYLRQKGGWNASTSLRFALTYGSTSSAYTCSKVPLSVYKDDSNSFVQVQMDDVWQINGIPNFFLTDSGRTHVGGPLMPNYAVYSYDGTKLTVQMTSSDKTNWVIYGTESSVPMSVTPA